MSNPPLSILVVDDEPTSRLLMSASLKKSGFAVRLAVDGDDALSQFRTQQPDLVMLDVEMPGLDGYQVCRTLRAAAGSALPVVMVTGMDNLDAIERAYEAGATDFIAKPINWSLIGHRVRYLLRSYLGALELRRANLHHAAILNAIPDLLFELDLNGRYLDYRAPRSDPLAAPPAHFIGRTLAEVLGPEAAAVCLAALHEAQEKGFSTGKQFQQQVAQEAHWFELSVAPKHADAGPQSQFIVLSRDITERKVAEQRITRLAHFDNLTGLPNRLSFLEQLAQAMQHAQCAGSRLAILFLDLDGFKHINETLGHAVGDLILQLLADRLHLGVRPTDQVCRLPPGESGLGLARLGGDEFTLIIPQLAHNEQALALARRISALIRRPFSLEGRELVLTASIGIAVYPDDGDSPDGLLRYAGTAMYHAKRQGRDHCQFYSTALTEQAMRRLDLESNLRLALERGQFFLAYQPQIDLASGRIRSVEALIRWQHPEQGVISPLEFIPLAEETGLIVPIGEWVLRTACATAARWHAAGHGLRMAVNLSPMQFRNPDLLAGITRILAGGYAARWLELEITESALMDDSDNAWATLRALRAAGVRIALDDFGTGYSSMSYLTRLPLNMIKVDQSFVRGLAQDADSLTIVRTIVTMAKNLGFAVTAEGVETLEQARILRGLSCDTLQGYYFSKPVPAAAIAPLLGQRWHFGNPTAAP